MVFFLLIYIGSPSNFFNYDRRCTNCLAVKNRTIQTNRDMSNKNIENWKGRLTHCEWSLTLKEINPSRAYSTFIDKCTGI